jgi:hypothetical protein
VKPIMLGSVTDLEIQIFMDDIAHALKERGMSPEKIGDYLRDEVDRVVDEMEEP